MKIMTAARRLALSVMGIASLYAVAQDATVIRSDPPAPPVLEEEGLHLPTEVTAGFTKDRRKFEFNGDILFPLATADYDSGDLGLVFINPRTAITDRDAEEYNIGLGYRHLFNDRQFILGANTYYDYRDTGFGSYNQWGAGVEFLSKWIDARANYYRPQKKEFLVDRQVVSETHQTVKTSGSGLGDPYGKGHAIVQDVGFERTVTSVTTTRTFDRYMQSRRGYDLEVGVLLPLPIAEEKLAARLFGGYYDFDADYNRDASGWKVRGEVRLYSSLFIDAALHENDRLSGSDWYAGARLSIPLDFSRSRRKRSVLTTADARCSAAPRMLAQRMTEMVIRDPHVRVDLSEYEENTALTSRTTTRKKEGRGSTTVTLLDDINFVLLDAVDGDGTAERPYGAIQDGVDAAHGGKNVYVHAADGIYRENVVLSDGVTLLGSSIKIAGVSGRSFGGGAAPVIDGMSLGPTITLANNTRVSGFTIQNSESLLITPANMNTPVTFHRNGSRIGILAGNATGITLTDLNLNNVEEGIRLYSADDMELELARIKMAGDGGTYGLVAASPGKLNLQGCFI